LRETEKTGSSSCDGSLGWGRRSVSVSVRRVLGGGGGDVNGPVLGVWNLGKRIVTNLPVPNLRLTLHRTVTEELLGKNKAINER
jgi:hypothetical protein